MTSPNLRADIYDPKALAAMDQAFAAVWHMLRADDPFRDYASDAELKNSHRQEAAEPCCGRGDGSSPTSKSHRGEPAYVSPLRRALSLPAAHPKKGA